MGIETLTKAAKAAGYAMAGQDEDVETSVAPATRDTQPVVQARTTLPAVVPVQQPEPTMAQWLRGALGVFGRGAPA